jgi:hypothetical protein
MAEGIRQPEPGSEDESPWQRDLREVRGLLRNVVVNHERVRDRVKSLKDFFDEGLIDTTCTKWEEWAIDYFADSPAYLKYISSPHPIKLDKWEKKIAKTKEIEAENKKKADALRAQEAWDEIVYDAKRAQEGWDQYKKEEDSERKRESEKEIIEKETQHKIDTAKQKAEGNKKVTRIRNTSTRAKGTAKPKAQPDPTTNPPVEAAQTHLNNCAQIERKSRVDLGREYAALKELADKRLLGKNPQGKPWLFKPFCGAYIPRSYRDINRCIEEYKQSVVENGTSRPMSQSENVVSLREIR